MSPNRRQRHEHVQKKKLTKAKSEPALVRGVVIAVLALLTSLGVEWAADVDVALATGVVVAVLALAQAVWTRFAVTANAKVVTRVTTSGEAVAGDAALAETGAILAVTTHDHTFPVVAPVAVHPGLIDDEP